MNSTNYGRMMSIPREINAFSLRRSVKMYEVFMVFEKYGGEEIFKIVYLPL